MNREKTIIRTSIIGIIGNLLLVGVKAAIGFIGNSISVIMDAVNNLSDVLSSVITIIGTKIAGKKPDKKHPYGHGRVEYLTSLIISIIILFAGGSAIYQSINSLISGEKSSHTNISLIIISIAIVVKIVLGLFYRKMGKKTNSDALKGSGMDALFDALLSFGTLIGAIIAMFFDIYIEGYIGIVIGSFIIRAGVEIIRGAISNIIGERTSNEVAIAIKKAVCSFPEVLGAYDLILNNYGPNRSIGSIHIEVRDDLTAKEIHPLSRAISAKIYEEFGTILTVGIYSSNTANSEIRKFVYELVRGYKEVKEIHGFYVDLELKLINFDLIIGYEFDNSKEIIEEIKDKIIAQYNDYQVYIVQDFDFSD